MGNNKSIQQGRFRINRTATLALTTSWQTVDFNGSSTYNTNTFGIDPETGAKMVSWDSTNKIVKFKGNYDRNYDITIYPETNANLITTRSSLQLRYVIPNGAGAGVDLYFPFSDTSQPFADLGEVTLLANGVRHIPLTLPVTVTQSIRTNGIRIELRISNSLITLGVCNLTNCALVVQE